MFVEVGHRERWRTKALIHLGCDARLFQSSSPAKALSPFIQFAIFSFRLYVLFINTLWKDEIVRIRKKSTLERYGISILAFVVALALRVLGKPVLGHDSPFLFFFSALALASWYGGLGPGILATLLGALAAAVLFFPPITPQGTVSVIHCLHICVYTATGLFISALMKKLHSAIDRLAKAEQELENKVQERTEQLARANNDLRSEKNKFLAILDRMREAVYIVNP
jgi:K+-sensing histidine kinase KdpD